VVHPHPLAHGVRAALCCAPPLDCGRRMDSARAARGAAPAPSHVPLPILAPPIAAALHPPAVATAEVHATGDLRVLSGIEPRASLELHNDELRSSKQQGDIALALKAHVASVCSSVSYVIRGMLQGFRMDVAKVD
jgi:hypothetical protein